MKKYELLKHTADLAIKGYGKNLSELFVNLAEGLFKEMTIGKKESKLQEYKIKVEGESKEALLINYLNELIYKSEVEHISFNKFKILDISKKNLRSIAYGTPLLRKKIDVKGATFYGLKINYYNNHFYATIIFDV